MGSSRVNLGPCIVGAQQLFTEPELSTGLAHSGPSANPYRFELGPPLIRSLPMPGHCCKEAHTSAVAPGPTGAQGCRDLAHPETLGLEGRVLLVRTLPNGLGPAGARWLPHGQSVCALASGRPGSQPHRYAPSAVWPWINPPAARLCSPIRNGNRTPRSHRESVGKEGSAPRMPGGGSRGLLRPRWQLLAPASALRRIGVTSALSQPDSSPPRPWQGSPRPLWAVG